MVDGILIYFISIIIIIFLRERKFHTPAMAVKIKLRKMSWTE